MMKDQSIELGALTRVVEEFNATLHRPGGDLDGVWVRIEHNEYEPSEPSVTLHAPQLASTFSIREILADGYECRMTCRSPFEFPLTLWGVNGWKISGEKIELDISGYDLGAGDEALLAGEEVTVFAYLTRGRLEGIRSPLLSYDGSITFDYDKKEDHEEKVVEWEDSS